MDQKTLTDILMNNPIPDAKTYKAFAELTVEAQVKEEYVDYDALVDMWMDCEKPDPSHYYTTIYESMMYGVIESLKKDIPHIITAIEYLTGNKYSTTEQAITALRNFKRENSYDATQLSQVDH